MKCPVCNQPVVPNVGGRNIDKHRNSLGNVCVEGTGLPIRICKGEL